MKKTLIVLIVLAITGLVLWRYSGMSVDNGNNGSATTTDTVSPPSSQTVKVSDKLSEYKNDELGYSVKYPTNWEKTESPSNVTFTIDTVDDQVKNTIGKLEAKIDVVSGACAFPPLTTIKERSTVSVKDRTFNMVSMSNTIQGRNYFSRMYTLQKDSTCYYFTFSAVTISPTNKGYSGAESQKIGARNILLVDSADTQFKDMIKTFDFVVGPSAQDESVAAPRK